MIELDFRLDEHVLKEDSNTNLVTANEAALQETYFEMPVRLRINDRDLLAAEGVTVAPWLPLPLLDVASVATDIIEGLGEDAVETYSLPGSGWNLRFERRGRDVEVVSSVNGTRVTIPYQDLRAAVVMFRERVRSVLRTRAPTLINHAHWGQWLQGRAA